MLTFREYIIRIAPPWLRSYVGSRTLFSYGVTVDELGDLAVEGIRARFPDEALLRAQYDALTLIGRDRRIYRGPNEPWAAYVERLKRWWDDWKMAGSAFAVLRQLRAYLTPDTPRMRLVNNAGAWYTLESDGTASYHAPANWDWDGQSDLWSRFWVIIYCAGGKPFDVGPRWGDPGFVYDAAKTWGTTATPDQVRSIRNIIQTWKSAHSRCEHIIVAFDPASFDPDAPGGSPPHPNGTWGRWSDTSVPAGRARLSTARYWKGYSP